MPVLRGREGGEGRSRERLRWRYPVWIRILGCMAILIGLAMVAVADAAEYDVPPGDTAALIRAIDNANNSRGSDIIRLAPGRYEVTAIHNTTHGKNGLPVIASEITIEGDGSTNTVIIRSPDIEELGLFRVARQGHLTLKRLTLQDGDVWGGSGIFNERGGELTIERCALIGLHNAVWNEG